MIEQLYRTYLQHSEICTDTRKINAGCLFFCLKGENFDGNTFATQALEAGAAAVVTTRTDLPTDDRIFVVDDTLKTLQQLASHHRQQLDIPFIGITGTNGKTTTKELVATVLQTKYKIAYTQGNFNNHIGVPLTLLSIPTDTEIAIVEMGANHVGEIAGLCDIAQPNYGLITNIGVAHIEGFGSKENIIKTKRAMYEAVMGCKGTIFVNGGDSTLTACAGDYQKQVRYGACADSTCPGEITDMNPYLEISIEGKKYRTHLTGEYNLPNMLCAIAVGKYFGVDAATAASAIANYEPSNNRSQIIERESNTIIADFYNANPTSMTAAINNLAHLPHPNKCAILGDMLELGSVSEQEHRNIVELCQKNKISAIFVGHCFAQLNLPDVTVFHDVDEANAHLAAHPIRNAMILVKGSRGVHLERIEM
ncbi:MAG: UDP-N-acetylmuramoyl-tripeptide--D-alanyl-D-alanine ligase [Bacteroidales bacterium]|nr:UDP-N-acetylmuramoyl-tripeptide--D-alanyl-D-alanine ligase [Bacteroidales bacterium]